MSITWHRDNNTIAFQFDCVVNNGKTFRKQMLINVLLHQMQSIVRTAQLKKKTEFSNNKKKIFWKKKKKKNGINIKTFWTKTSKEWKSDECKIKEKKFKIK